MIPEKRAKEVAEKFDQQHVHGEYYKAVQEYSLRGHNLPCVSFEKDGEEVEVDKKEVADYVARYLFIDDYYNDTINHTGILGDLNTLLTVVDYDDFTVYRVLVISEYGNEFPFSEEDDEVENNIARSLENHHTHLNILYDGDVTIEFDWGE